MMGDFKRKSTNPIPSQNDFGASEFVASMDNKTP